MVKALEDRPTPLIFGSIRKEPCLNFLDHLSYFSLAFFCSTSLGDGHSQLCDCADLDTSFSHFDKSLPQPEIKVHLEMRFIFRSALVDFQLLTEKPVLSVLRPMILF